MYMFMYLWSSNTAYIAYWCLYCVKKNEAILTQIPYFRAVLWLYQFKWNHMVWFSQSQWLSSKLRSDVLNSVTQSACFVIDYDYGYVWLCQATTSGWSRVMTNKDGALNPKEYEIIMLIYNRKSCRLDLISFWAPEDMIL